MFVLLLPLPLAFFRASELHTSPCSLLGVLSALFTPGRGGRESIRVIAMCQLRIPALLCVYPPKQRLLRWILLG